MRQMMRWGAPTLLGVLLTVGCAGAKSQPPAEDMAPAQEAAPVSGNDLAEEGDLDFLCALPPSDVVSGATAGERLSMLWSYWRDNVRSERFAERLANPPNELELVWLTEALEDERPDDCPIAHRFRQVLEPPQAAVQGTAIPAEEATYTADHIRGVMRAHDSDFAECFRPLLIDAPDLHGKIMVVYMIEADGGVEKASIAESTLPEDAGFDACIVDVLTTMEFHPRDDDQTIVKINYPLSFSP